MDLSEKLERIGACGPAVRWARGRQLPEAWRECQRADWMAWLLSRWATYPNDRQAVRMHLVCTLFANPLPGGPLLGSEWSDGIMVRKASLAGPPLLDSLQEANQVSADVGAIALYLARADRDVALGYLRSWAAEIRKVAPEFADPGPEWWEAAA